MTARATTARGHTVIAVRLPLVVIMLGAALASPVARAAATPPVSLSFERARGLERCATRDDVVRAVRARLAYDPFADDAEREIWVRLDEQGERHVVASIWISRDGVPTGSRELIGARAHCQELVDAIALAISIAVDPLFLAPPPARAATDEGGPPKGDDEPARRTIVTSRSEPPPTALVPRPTSMSFEVGLGAKGGLGIGPGALFDGTLSVGARSGPVSLHVEGWAELPGDVAITDEARLGGFFAGAAFLPCFRVWAGRLLAGRAAWATGCGLTTAGALFAGGEGLSHARLVVAPWVGLGGRAMLDVALLPWLALRAHADVLAPVVRTSLVDAASGTPLWTSPLVAARGGTMLVAFFP